MSLTIRDARGQYVASGPAVRLLTQRAAIEPVAAVAVHVAGDGPALLSVTWLDGATGTCEWNDARACCDWLRGQAWARGRTRVYFPRGAQP